MSIIYDALQKTQKNLENKRDATIRRKLVWVDKSLYFIIGGLMLVNIAAYYPHFTRHVPNLSTSSATIKQPIQSAPSETPTNLKQVNNRAPSKSTVVGMNTSTFVHKPTSTHPPVEQLFEPMKNSQITSPSTAIVSAEVIKQPLVQKEEVETSYDGKLVLNGVFTSEMEKIALINNQSYHVGDTVDGFKILSIDPNRVKLQDSHGIVVIRSAA